MQLYEVLCVFVRCISFLVAYDYFVIYINQNSVC